MISTGGTAMRGESPGEAKRPLSEIEDEIAKIKAEIDEKYYLLGKTVCDIADKDAGKIGELVDKLVVLKKELKAPCLS
jgi:hypothetical protein